MIKQVALLAVALTSLMLINPLKACERPEPCARTDAMPEMVRMERYRGPTPSCVPNGKTVTTKDLQKLIEEKSPLLIDVLSVLRRPESTDFDGDWLPNNERLSLPSAVWLPNVGYGMPDNDIKQWFGQTLSQLSKQDESKPIVFFCIADCWMSWNAVQHASNLGYDQLYWYKDGTDGWSEADLPLVPVDPLPLVLDEP